jgi:hypothetical protein
MSVGVTFGAIDGMFLEDSWELPCKSAEINEITWTSSLEEPLASHRHRTLNPVPFTGPLAEHGVDR